jgi:hypothetical protein
MTSINCDTNPIYKDKYITILQPRDPRGVEVLHTIGYMGLSDYSREYIENENLPNNNGYNEMNILKRIKKEGLKSSEQILKERGIKRIPVGYSEKLVEKFRFNNETPSNILERLNFLKYDPKQFTRIFLRPPSTTPFQLNENGEIVSAGNWRDFLGHPREHRLFFGGESYTDSGKTSSQDENMGVFPTGVVTLRVDPDETYVFLETMKGQYNLNRNTGMKVPASYREYPKATERYGRSRILLSQFLDELQGNPGKVDTRYEILATIPQIPACAFEKVLYYGDDRFDGEEIPEDKIMKTNKNSQWRRFVSQGMILESDVDELLTPAKQLRSQINFRKITDELERLLKNNRTKPEELEAQYEILVENWNKIGAILVVAREEIKNPKFLPIQVDYFREIENEFEPLFTTVIEYRKRIDSKIKELEGAESQNQTSKTKSASSGGKRKTRKLRKTRVNCS